MKNNNDKIAVGRFLLFTGIIVCAWWEMFPPCFLSEETCRLTSTKTREVSETLLPPPPAARAVVARKAEQQPHQAAAGLSSSSIQVSPATTAMTTVEEENWPTIEYHRKKPIFSFSLPNTGMNILPRYFKCADETSITPGTTKTHQYNKFGRYWTYIDNSKVTRKPIGECMYNNWFKEQDDILMNCGNYRVWHDLQFLRHGDGNSGSPGTPGECFDPVLFPGSLQQMYQTKPNATVFLQIPDFDLWYQRLNPHLHEQWKEWCNPTHDNFFPTNKTREQYYVFYNQYHQRIRDFVQSHPSWNLIELDLQNTTHTQIANRLQQQLEIDSKCWMQSVQGNISLPSSVSSSSSSSGSSSSSSGSSNKNRHQEHDDRLSATLPVITNTLIRPNDITYPILTVSLPRSGTTTVHNYFKCNLGRGFSSHQFTTQRYTTIGECIQNNVQENLPMLENCGNAYVFSDIGIINPRNGTKNACYYTQLSTSTSTSLVDQQQRQQQQRSIDGLENFAKYYPYGTILLTVRTNVTSWVHSITKWSNLKEKWSKAKKCQGIFPPQRSSTEVWIEFYNNFTKSIRQFVKHHPTLTYVEIPLADETGPIMDDVFGFHSGCWGHANANTELSTTTVATK